jgi:hypothetical protein
MPTADRTASPPTPRAPARADTVGSLLRPARVRAVRLRVGVGGQRADEDIQWRKLELVGRVADRIWGTR